MAKIEEIRVPDIGDFEAVEVIDVLVSEGDLIEAEDPLITLESDKAAMDLPAPKAGRVKALKVSRGDKVSEGSLVLQLEVEEDRGEEGGQPAGESEGDTSGGQRGERRGEERDAAEAEPAPKAPEPGDGSGRGGREQIEVPDIGDFEDVEVIDVLVAEGDEVEAEDPLITLESDKAAMDVPSPKAGRIVELNVGKGDKVSEGDPIAIIVTRAEAGERTDTVRMPRAAEGEKRPREAGRKTDTKAPRQDDEERKAQPGQPRRRAGKAEEAQPKPKTRRLPPIDEAGFARAHASPSVRKFARELGADLTRIEGSGRKGRVTRDDVKAWVKARLAGGAGTAAGAGAWPMLPEIDFEEFGETETRELSRIQKLSGPRLHASWVNIPHVAQFDEADITELEQARKDLKQAAEEQGIKLTPLGFILKACVDTLKEFPIVNASLAPDGERLILKKYFHLGFAVDTPSGLIVPVIRDVDRKDIYEIARELAELSDRARNNKLKREQLQGGCFTISSLGGIGGTGFTPIINAPEVAILGVSRAIIKPVWRDGEFVPRLMLPFSFCYDHRVIDGALAVRFTRYLAERLADVQALTQAIP